MSGVAVCRLVMDLSEAQGLSQVEGTGRQAGQCGGLCEEFTSCSWLVAHIERKHFCAAFHKLFCHQLVGPCCQQLNVRVVWLAMSFSCAHNIDMLYQ